MIYLIIVNFAKYKNHLTRAARWRGVSAVSIDLTLGLTLHLFKR